MTGNETIEANLKEYFEVCKLMNQLEIRKDQLRGNIQTEMALNNLDKYTNDLGIARFKVQNRENVNREKLKELVTPAVLSQILEMKEIRMFEIRSQESLDKSKTAFNNRSGGKQNGNEN